MTKWTGEFYDLRAEVNRMYADIRAQRARGAIEDAEETIAENRNYLKHRRQLNRIGQQLTRIRAQKRQIVGDREMTGAENE